VPVSGPSALARLAERCGIRLDYHDIWGSVHRVSDATCRGLLASMGEAAGSEEEAAASLERLDAAEWLRVTPPVLVVREPLAAVTVPLAVPVARLATPLTWTLGLEDGTKHAGTVAPDALPVTQRGHADGEEIVRLAWQLPLVPPQGYHVLHVHPGENDADAGFRTTVIVAPAACFPLGASGGPPRVWGPAVQLYAVRSRRSWGIGDFTDLAAVVDLCVARGAALVGVSPLHALFPGEPRHASPYSASSRAFWNPLHLDVEATPEFAECTAVQADVASEGFRARLAAVRAADEIDYAAVAALKQPVLEALYRHFRERQLTSGAERAAAFDRFRVERGPALRRYAVFEALAEHFRSQDPPVRSWPEWPDAYQDPEGPAVTAFAASRRNRVEFYEWLQWQCGLQLGAAARRARERGATVGLYLDVAVSVDQAGFDAWAGRGLFARGASLGAPPDDFNLDGQDWGLSPMVPGRLRDTAYAPVIEALRANMRHAGAVRLDHVMALQRTFWIPAGGSARDGAYVQYPFADLLGVLALESRRNACAVVGEDLGTVPDEVRAELAALGVLSYRLFYFSRDADGAFLPPSAYPAQALVAVTTHDLPTLPGWWLGRDLAVRAALQLFPDEARRHRQEAARPDDRARALAALTGEGLAPAGVDPSTADGVPPELVVAIYRFLARCPAQVLTVQLEDVLGQVDQVNVPGTVEQYPNWRRRLPADLETLETDPRLEGVIAGVRRERPTPTP